MPHYSLDVVARAFEASHTVEMELGRGSLSSSFKAREIGSGAPVVIRVLRSEYDRNARLRFHRNMPLLAAARHAGLRVIREFGAKGELDYVITEYVDGETLERLVGRTGPLEVSRALRIGAQLCDALQATHDRQMVHGEIAPDAIFVEDDRTVLDGGALHRVLGPPDNQAPDGQSLIGNPVWLAPEQLTGDLVSWATDVYLVGVVLHYMLTARRPYAERASMQEIFLGIVKGKLPRVSQIRPVPAAIDAVVARATDGDPKRRYETAAEFATALRSIR